MKLHRQLVEHTVYSLAPGTLSILEPKRIFKGFFLRSRNNNNRKECIEFPESRYKYGMLALEFTGINVYWK